MSKVVAASKISRKPARRIAFYACAMSEVLHTGFGGSEGARTVLLYLLLFCCALLGKARWPFFIYRHEFVASHYA